MAKQYLKDQINQAYKNSKAYLKRTTVEAIDRVYSSEDPEIVAAYEQLILKVNEMTQGRITVGKLEKIAEQLKPRTQIQRKQPEKPKTKRITANEYYQRREAGESYKDIKADYPKQDIRGLEGTYKKHHKK